MEVDLVAQLNLVPVQSHLQHAVIGLNSALKSHCVELREVGFQVADEGLPIASKIGLKN